MNMSSLPKKVFPLVLVIVCLSQYAYAQPEIDVNPLTLMFGDQDIGAGPTATMDVTIDNLGVGNLNFTSVSLTGTDAADFNIGSDTGEDPLLPAGTRTVSIEFNPITTGAKSAMLTIVSDDADEGTVNVALSGTGTAAPEIDVSPLTLMFGDQDISSGPTATMDVTIDNLGSGNLNFTSVSLTGTDAADFNIGSDTGEDPLLPAGTRTVSVEFNPMTTGVKSAMLTIVSDDVDEGTVNVALSGTGTTPEIDVSPLTLMFGDQDISSGPTATMDVTIDNLGSGNLNFTSVSLTGTDAADFNIGSDTGEDPLLPAGSRTVSVEFNPITIGAKSAMLTIVSDDADEGTVNVALSGTGTSAPEIDVSPLTLMFGDQDIGAGPTATMDVTIDNLGSANLNFTSVSLTGTDAADFNIGGDTGEDPLLPAGTRTVSVEFNPVAAGAKSAMLTIVSDDADEGTVNVALSGTGTQNEDPFDAGSLSDVTVLEDQATNFDISSIDISDPDAGANDIEVDLNSTSGLFTASNNLGVTVAGSPGANLTFTGTVAELNSYFDDNTQIQYTHSTLNENGNDVGDYEVILNDLGNTGTGGGGDVNLGTFNVDVDPVNDEPTLTLIGTPNQTDNSSDNDIGPIAPFVATVDFGGGETQNVLSYTVTNDNNSLFDTQPTITRQTPFNDPTTDELTYSLAPNAEGMATVTVRVQDDGGTPGVDLTTLGNAVSFMVTVSDDEAPGIISGVVDGPTETTFNFTVDLNELADVYWIVRENPSTTPTVNEVRTPSGEIASNNFVTDGNGDGMTTVTGLAGLTNYDFYWIAEDQSSGDNQTTVQSANISTTDDVTGPSFNSSSIQSVEPTSAIIRVDLDESGTVHYVFVDDPSAIPSGAQIMAGTDAGDNPVLRSGSYLVESANTNDDSDRVNFLEANNAYNLYLVAEDASGNLSAVVEQIDFSTDPIPSPSGTEVITSPTVVACIGAWTDVTEIYIDELSNGGFQNESDDRTIILTLPPGFVFRLPADGGVTPDIDENGGTTGGSSDNFNEDPSFVSLTSTVLTLKYSVNGTNLQDGFYIRDLEVMATEVGASGTLQRLSGNGGTATLTNNGPGDGVAWATFSVGNAGDPPDELTGSMAVGLCEGDSPTDVTGISASNSANFEWYSDASLTILEHTGEVMNYTTDLGIDMNTSVQNLTFYVVDAAGGTCPSDPAAVEINVNANPGANAGTNFDSCNGDEVTLGGFPSLTDPTVAGTYTYTWTGPEAIPQVANPMFTPADNNTGSDRIDTYTLVITDPNGCDSPSSMIDLTVHDGINPTLSYEGGVTAAIPNSPPLDLVVTPLAVAPPTTSTVFTGSGIAYNSDDMVYEFFPGAVPEGFTYTTTYTVTDGFGCMESVSADIEVADQSVFDPVVIDNCDEDVPYQVELSMDLKTDIANAGETFVELRYANGNPLPRVDLGAVGNDIDDGFILSPNLARLGVGGAFGVANVNVITSPLGIFVKQNINVFENPPTALPTLNAFHCTDDTPFQLIAEVDGNTVSAGSGTFGISSSMSGPFAPNAGLDAAGNIDFSMLAAGTWYVQYQSDAADDDNGCTSTDVFSFENIAPPTVPRISLNTNYQEQPADLDFLNENAGVFTWVYCEGDIIQDFFLDFDDIDDDKVQDVPDNTKEFFRWYDDPALGAADELTVTVGFGDEDGRFVDRFDLFPAQGGSPTPGTYDFYVTATSRRDPFPGGATFLGCESAATQITFEIIADPDQHLITSSGFEDVGGIITIEYCSDESIQPIDVNLSSPSPIGGDEFIWTGATLGTPYVTNSNPVNPTDLGLGSDMPGPNTLTSTNYLVEYTSSPNDPNNFQVGEFIVSYTIANIFGTLTSGTITAGQTVTGPEGTAVVQSFGGTSINVNTVSGFFFPGQVVTTPTGQFLVNDYFRSDAPRFGIIVSDDGFRLEVQPSGAQILPGDQIIGNTTKTQAISSTVSTIETVVPYTFFFTRNDGRGTIAADAGEGEFPGCSGPVTQVDIWVYPVPDAPPATTLFDTFIYACVGDLTDTDDVLTPSQNNPDIRYDWYTNSSGGSSFASDDITYADLELQGMNLGTSGIDLFYLSQVTNSSTKSASLTTGFGGCESDNRTEVRIEIFDIPAEPTVEARDNLGSNLSTTTGVGGILQFLVCEDDVNNAFEFEANPLETVAAGEEYNWYTSATGTSFNPINDFIGEFTKTATAGNLSLGSLSTGALDLTAPGSYFFAVVKTENIIAGEFGGCESDPTFFELLVQPIPGEPTASTTLFQVCEGNTIDPIDPDLGAGTFVWYASETDIGINPLYVGNMPDPDVAPDSDPIGNPGVGGLGLDTSIPGDVTYFVTEITNTQAATPNFPGCETLPGNAREIIINVSDLPTPSITPGLVGFPASNEYCFDEQDLFLDGDPDVTGLPGESGVFTSDNPLLGNAGISNNPDGTATFNFQAAYNAVASMVPGDIDANGRATYVVDYTYIDPASCENSVTQTILINRRPTPTFEVQRGNDDSEVLATGGQTIDICQADLSNSSAAIADRIVLLDKSAAINGTISQVTFAGRLSTAGLDILLAENELENTADITDGEAYFYPNEAIERFEGNIVTDPLTFLEFTFNLQYTNTNLCQGTASQLGNEIVIRVFKTPVPTMDVTIPEGEVDNTIEVCVDHDTVGDPIIFSNDGVGFDFPDDGGTFTYSGITQGTMTALTNTALLQTGDQAEFFPQEAYNQAILAGDADGSNPAIFEISYLYEGDPLPQSPNTPMQQCFATSNVFTVTVNPLPNTEFNVTPGGQEQWLDAASINALIDSETIFFPLEEEDIGAGTEVTLEFCQDAPPIQLFGRGFFGPDVMTDNAGGVGVFSSDRGDAGIANSGNSAATFDPTSAFNISGETVHEIFFTYTDDQGCQNVNSKTFIINPKPTVTIDEVGGCNGEAVQFNINVTDLALGDAIQFVYWDFEDGTEDDVVSTNLSESYIYEGEGERSVSVQVFTTKGCTSLERTSDFFIGDIPNTNFTYTGLCSDEDFIFSALPRQVNIGVVENFTMDYDDGSDPITVVRQDPDPQIPPEDFILSHNFPAAGVYEVSLTVVTTNGCTSTHSRLVPVLPTIVVTPDNPYVETFEGSAEILVVPIGEVDGEIVFDTLFVDGWVPDLRILDDRDEVLDAGMEVNVARDRFTNNTWQFGPVNGSFIGAGANGSANAWLTNLNGPFADNENSWVFTPCFDISALERPMVRFQRAFQFNDVRDGVVFQYSVDNGATWNVLGNQADPQGTGINWYEAEGLQGNPGEQDLNVINLVGWGGGSQSGLESDWIEARHKLDEIPFENGERRRVIFRFAIGAQSGDNQTGANSSEGFGVDDFIIEERGKQVFVEHFTGSFLGDASLPVDLNELRETLEEDQFASGVPINNNDAVLVTYKTDIAGPDPINAQNSADNNARVVFYGVESLSTTVLNGVGGSAANTDTQQTGPFSEISFNQSSLPEPDIDINLQVEDAAGDQVAVTVNMTNNSNIAITEEIRLYIAVVEKTVEDNGVLIRNLMRKLLPDGSGNELISDGEGNLEAVSQSWSIQRVQDPDNLAIVAWIQNSQSKQVIQAVQVDAGDKDDNIVTGIDDEILESSEVSIYPNPAHEQVVINFGAELEEDFDWVLYNQVGMQVFNGNVEAGKEEFSIETLNFPSGLYFLRVGNDNKRFKHFKLLIEH